MAVEGYEPDPVALESGAEGERGAGDGQRENDRRSTACASLSRELSAQFLERALIILVQDASGRIWFNEGQISRKPPPSLTHFTTSFSLT